MGRIPNALLEPADALAVTLGGGDLEEVIYVDHYGNAFTGIRALDSLPSQRLAVRGCEIGHGSVFSAVPPGTAFWYENSVGLVEIAVNGGSAARSLDLAVGETVRWQ